jgi:hypothetical protein
LALEQPFGAGGYPVKGIAHDLEIGSARLGDDQPLALAVEELQSQLCLKRFDLMADRALRDTQLFGGACEAFVPSRSLEGLERIQGRQAARHEHNTS